MRRSTSQLSRAQSQYNYENDPSFQNQVRNCISSLDRMPKLKEKVFDKLRSLDEHFTEQEGQRGILEAEKTRIRLKNQKIQQQRMKKRQLEEMIQLTA